jgi:hypothetical protein
MKERYLKEFLSIIKLRGYGDNITEIGEGIFYSRKDDTVLMHLYVGYYDPCLLQLEKIENEGHIRLIFDTDNPDITDFRQHASDLRDYMSEPDYCDYYKKYENELKE